MNSRRLRDFILPRLLLVAAIMCGALLTGYGAVHADTQINVGCDINQLNAAVNTANTDNRPDVINLAAAPCVYTLSGTLTLYPGGGQIYIKGNGAVIDGASTYAVLSVTQDASVIIEQLTIQHGFAASAAALSNYGDVTLTSCIIENNIVRYSDGIGERSQAAAIFNVGKMTIQETTLRNNSAGGDGGAISNDGFGDLTLIHSTIENNTAGRFGGAIYNADTVSKVYAQNTILSGNSAEYGAGIYNAGTLDFYGGGLADNIANKQGGGLYNTHEATLNVVGLSRNSAVSGDGGGVENNGGTLATRNSRFENNKAKSSGGGIDNHDGTLTVSDSQFANNSANAGGGINNQLGTAVVTNSTFSGNSATYGGGIKHSGPNMDITNATVSNNTAQFGAGIYNEYHTLTLTSSTLSGNSASENGGGILNGYGTFNVTNSTLSGNSAYYQGGAIYNFMYSGALSITSSTIADNTSSQNLGSGVFNSNSNAGLVTLRNTIVARNPLNGGSDVVGAFTSQGYNLIGNGTGATGLVNGVNGDRVGTAAAPIGPALLALADNGGSTKTMAPIAGSLALNVIPPANCAVTVDQRGVSRPQGINCDIGAFELESGVPREITEIPTDTMPAPTNTALVPTNTATIPATQTLSPTIVVPTNTPQVPDTPVPTPWGPPPRDDS